MPQYTEYIAIILPKPILHILPTSPKNSFGKPHFVGQTWACPLMCHHWLGLVQSDKIKFLQDKFRWVSQDDFCWLATGGLLIKFAKWGAGDKKLFWKLCLAVWKPLSCAMILGSLKNIHEMHLDLAYCVHKPSISSSAATYYCCFSFRAICLRCITYRLSSFLSSFEVVGQTP